MFGKFFEAIAGGSEKSKGDNVSEIKIGEYSGALHRMMVMRRQKAIDDQRRLSKNVAEGGPDNRKAFFAAMEEQLEAERSIAQLRDAAERGELMDKFYEVESQAYGIPLEKLKIDSVHTRKPKKAA